MAKDFDDDGYRLNALHARQADNKRVRHPDVWWYEERGGIAIYFAISGGVSSAWIPHKQLAEYVAISPTPSDGGRES